MGLLRFLLAVAVVLCHVQGCTYYMSGPAVSVQTFYVVSGFFIAMILDTKYTRLDQIGLFFSNRFLRIYSVYWLFLLLTAGYYVAVGLVTHHSAVIDLWDSNASRMGYGGAAFLVFTNVALFGQDWTLFLRLGQNALHWTLNFRNSKPILADFLLVPQAWSLGVELSFYLLAPWLLRRKTSVLVVLTALTFGFRYILWRQGLRIDPWSYRFFPVELGTFLVGALSYRLIYRRIKSIRLSWGWKLFALGLFPAIVLYPWLDPNKGYLFFTGSHMVFFAYAALAIPILFRMTGRNALDRQIGELSFPLYLGHFLVIHVIERLSNVFATVTIRAIAAIGISSLVAYVSVIFVDSPINRFRQWRVDQSRKAPLATL